MQGLDDLPAFVAAFTGSHRHVVEYLAEEVLNRQPDHIKAFLLQTAILNRMCGPLCDAVFGVTTDHQPPTTNHEDEQPSVVGPPALSLSKGRSPVVNSYSQLILEQMERGNLFLVPLDQERRWYRYHQLFGDVLRYRLIQAEPERVPLLYRRAAGWCESQGLVAEAIGYALAIPNATWAARMVEQAADATWARGELSTLHGWLRALPEELVRSRTRLSLILARTLLLTGPLDSAERWLQDAERGLARLDAPEAARLRGEVAAIRATIASFSGDVPTTIVLAQEALAHLPADQLSLRALVAHNLAVAYRFRGDVREASQAFEESIALGQQAGNSYVVLDDIADLAIVQALQGRLGAAIRTAERGLQLATVAGQQQSAAAGVIHIQLAVLLRERNQLDLAAGHAARGVELSRRGGNVDFLLYGLITTAPIRWNLGDPEGARAALLEAEQVAQEYRVPRWIARVAAHCARLALAQGDLASAAHWAEQRTPRREAEPGELRELGDMLQVRLLIAQGRPGEALQLLRPLQEAAEQGERAGRVLEMLVLESLAHHAQQASSSALAALERAVALAEPEGARRVLLDEATLLPLLAELHTRSADPRWRSFLGELLGQPPPPAPITPAVPVAPALHTPYAALSERELEVLRLFAAGLSGPEIAQHLIVSVNTVKTQLKSIYSKLDVHTRSAAIARARALGLLPPV